MTDTPTDETGEIRVRPAVSIKVGDYRGLSFDIKPGTGESGKVNRPEIATLCILCLDGFDPDR